jgi:hypothetical protein
MHKDRNKPTHDPQQLNIGDALEILAAGLLLAILVWLTTPRRRGGAL